MTLEQDLERLPQTTEKHLEQSNLERRVQMLPRNPVIMLAELQRSCVQMGEISRRSTITAALFQTGQGGATNTSPSLNMPESPVCI